MSQLDTFISQLGATDTRKKIQLGTDIITNVNSTQKLECEDVGQFIDGLVPWLQSSNFKIVLNGLDIMYLVTQKLGDNFRPYISSVIPPTIDRLGDSKDAVREKAQLLLSSLMLNVLSANQILERMVGGFSHKNGKVREETMYCLQNALNAHGAAAVTISRLLPHVIKLLSDPTATVRDCAFNTLVEAYKHYGERLRIDLQKKYTIPAAKLTPLMTRFDDVRDTGLLLPTASGGFEGKADDETDRASVKSGGSKSRASSAPPVRRSVLGAAAPSSKGSAGTAAGAVDEASFFAAFEDAPKMNIYSVKDLDENMNKIRDCIQSPQNDWDKRVEALKKIRAVILAGGAGYEEFYPHLRLLEPAMQLSIKDLRSQVVREACISVAYMSQELHHKVDHFCETVLPTLVNLIPNTAKVMASAGIVTIRFIIQNTHHHKLIPILTRELNTKSREIRKVLCEFLDQLVHTWPTHSMEKHVIILAEALKKGISDADPEARLYSRKAYWGFADHFRDEADRLLNSLDPSYKKILQGEMSNSMHAGSTSVSSSHSHSSSAQPHSSYSRPTPRSARGSTENLSSLGIRRSAIPHLRPPAASPPSSLRSNSAIDLQAARRAQARAQYAHQQRMKIGSGASLPRPRKISDHPPMSSIASPDRTGRSRNRGGVSQSQPGSRSGSPSSRLSYATYNSYADSPSATYGRTRRRSGIPRSTGTSREPSPNRYGYSGPSSLNTGGSTTPKNRSRSISGSADMPPQIPNSRSRQPTIAHKTLQQSREAENALADALVCSPPYTLSLRSPGRKNYGSKSFDDQSDNDNESETSSVCSERSYDSFRRNDFMWYGSQQRVVKENWELSPKLTGINEIIASCASTHWADRKEGLVGLHSFLRGSHVLTGSELRRITELFTKMFMDTHTKVFSLFLDTLMELIIVHHADLPDWLYILVTRLLNKLGSDLLGSVQTKIHRTLDLVRDSFACDLQLQVLMRFLTDATQTPNSKVKVATLTYLKCLVDVMDASDLACSQDTPLALAKILAWTADQKSVEIRRASSAVFIAMFNCNMTELTNLLQQLPQGCQATASQIIQNHLKRAASLDASPSSLPARTPPSCSGTPTVLQSPNTSLPRIHRPLKCNVLDLDDTENLNPEEVSRSLKRTTDEIRNYSFDLDNNKDRRDSLEKHRDSTSQLFAQDSGISQLSTGGVDTKAIDSVDFKTGEEPNGLMSGRSSSVSSPTHRNLFADPSRNGLDTFSDDSVTGDLPNENDVEAMANAIAELSSSVEDNRVVEKKAAMSTLIRLARTGSTVVWNENFRLVLRLLLERLVSEDGTIRALALTVITEMMRRYPLVQHFLMFSELIILRVLKTHADKAKEVVRAAQVCSGIFAEILPPEIVIRILKPLIQMGEYPINQAAIKMLNKLVEAHPPSIIAAALPDIMPGLLRAYDDKDSSVRKASVFCMVSLHNSVREETIKPYLESLTGSKLKLLNLYIKRAENQSSGASSPKSDALNLM